ncbi:MAG: hypothetical protein ACI814_001866, partial [Mariniblastus sp.]
LAEFAYARMKHASMAAQNQYFKLVCCIAVSNTNQ